ncbi:pyruvate kinase [Candidatus Nitrosoglobus terrae]|uniref:Pyruvate kinase n=1 Tax=Candidatus Nitrosoglobus terrae TaxID=1630141 RepID=A0A1Q2SMH9_9GAMM|nr:pyruvate kinase [Candidatus Nitrosoglobus terrae]BAW80355.1 pyruvate kinase [Candidatus Nitrosoglobus terrae]
MSYSVFNFDKDPRACRIICTIGPASAATATLKEMILSGMNIARLNFSHGSYQSHEAIAHKIRKIAQQLTRPVAILQDLQGHKIRVGHTEAEKPIVLHEGQKIYLGFGERVSTERIGIDYQNITHYVTSGQHIFLDDGSLELEVLTITGKDIHCQVNLGGELKSRKGVVFPDSRLDFPLLDPKDEADACFGVSLSVDMLAMSFVRSATEIVEMRLRLAACGKEDPFIIAKIEDREGLENLGEILPVANAILIARGDLGVMLPREKVPGIQKNIIQQANAFGIPVITATQMLESMTYHDKPTRAEVSDVHGAVISGSDAVMLSGETASGHHPVRAVQEMDRICREAERELRSTYIEIPVRSQENMRDKIAASAVNLAHNVKACCILAFSSSGKTLKALAAARGNIPVYGVVGEESLLRKLLLYRGHSLIVIPHKKKLENLIDHALKQLREQDIANINASIVIIAREEEPEAKESYLLKLYLLS